MAGAKDEGITFKVDASLANLIRQLPNRSEFIRSAILAALEGSCPLCNGTGILSLSQQKHWKSFARDHDLAECKECKELRLVCHKGDRRRASVHAH